MIGGGISKLPATSGGGTDWSKLTVGNVSYRNQAVATSTNVEVLNITGKGLLSFIQFNTNIGAVNPGIIIDGVPFNGLNGLLSTDPSMGERGYLISANNELFELFTPIPFESSLVVRFRNQSTSSTASVGVNGLYYLE